MGEPQEDDRDEEDGLGELLERVFVSAELGEKSSEPVDRFVEVGNCSRLVRCLVVPRPEFDVLKFLQSRESTSKVEYKSCGK